MGKWFALERGIRNLYQVQEVKHDYRRELFFGWLDCGAVVRNCDGLVKEVTPGSVALEKIQGGVYGVVARGYGVVDCWSCCLGYCLCGDMYVRINSEGGERRPL